MSYEAIFVRVPLAQKSKSCGRLDGEDLAREIGRTPGCCEVDDNEASCGSQAFVEVLSAWFRPQSHQDTFCHQAKACTQRHTPTRVQTFWCSSRSGGTVVLS